MTAPDRADAADNPGADPSNWREAPFNRWAFRNIPAVLPVATIAAEPGRATPLAAAPVSLEGFQVRRMDGEALDLDGFLDATETDALVILKGGKIAFEAYRNGNGPATPHILMSASKSVTGLVVGALAGEGLLDPEAPVARYVPEVDGTAYADATVRQLVDMRTGIALDEAQAQAYEAASNWDRAPAGKAESGFHSFFESLDPSARKTPHGGPFAYVSSNTDLMGWVIERAGGASFAEIASRRLWRPLGAEQDACITLDRQGAPRCTGGVCAAPRDLARLGQLVLEGGARDGVQVIPRAWIDDMFAGGDRAAWRDGEWGQVFAPIGREMSYRSGWYGLHDQGETIFAMGIHGQNLFVDRTAGFVIAKLSSQAVRFDYPAAVLAHRAVHAFRRLLG